MAEWLVVFRGAVLRKCEAPDKGVATKKLRPDSSKGELVKSRASYELDGARDNVVQKCMYGCGRESAPDAKSCASCAKQRAAHRVAAIRES